MACSACCPASSACIQATEAIKLIIGIGEPLIGRFLIYDALQMRFRELKLQQGSGLPGVRHASDRDEADRLRAVLRRCARRAGGRTCESDGTDSRSTAVELKQRLDRGDKLTHLDVREPNEYQINRIPGSS